ncbi:GNAT family N-acetyltransferase [Methanopyrus sp.]
MGERTVARYGPYVVKEVKTDRYNLDAIRSLLESAERRGPGNVGEVVPPDVFDANRGLASDRTRLLVALKEGGIVACVAADPRERVGSGPNPHNVFGLVVSPEVRARYQLGHVMLAAALKTLREEGLRVARTTPTRRALPFFTGIRADPTYVYRELEVRLRWYRRTGNEEYLELTKVPREVREELELLRIRTVGARRDPTPFHRLDPEKPVHVFRSGVRSFTLTAPLGDETDGRR